MRSLNRGVGSVVIFAIWATVFAIEDWMEAVAKRGIAQRKANIRFGPGHPNTRGLQTPLAISIDSFRIEGMIEPAGFIGFPELACNWRDSFA